MHIKNIIFDVGNVIVTWSPPTIIKNTFPEYDQLQQESLIDEIFKSETWTHLNLGQLSEKDAKLKFISNSKILDPLNTDRLFDYIKSTQTLIPGTTDIIKSLHKNDYQLFALTDNIHEIIEYLKEKYNFWKYFQHVIVSAHIGLKKPSKEIFDYALQKNNLLPEETVFIDDYPPNVKSASSLGLHTILFSDAVSCLHELNRLGINTNTSSLK